MVINYKLSNPGFVLHKNTAVRPHQHSLQVQPVAAVLT
jgi:hypothetical protein